MFSEFADCACNIESQVVVGSLVPSLNGGNASNQSTSDITTIDKEILSYDN